MFLSAFIFVFFVVVVVAVLFLTISTDYFMGLLGSDMTNRVLIFLFVFCLQDVDLCLHFCFVEKKNEYESFNSKTAQP